MRRLILLLSVVALISCNNSTQTANQQNNTLEEADSSLVKAKLNFENYCSSCHGEQMQAFVDRRWKYGNSEDSLFASISKGHPEVGMPPFEAVLSEDEITGLVHYILSGIENVDKYVFKEAELKSDTFHTENFTFHLDTIMSGIDSPWGMAFLPEGEMLVTEKSGIVYKIDRNRNKYELSGAPEVRDRGQGGLLDVELHPDFENNSYVYLSYSIVKQEGTQTLSTTAVSRYELKGNALVNQQLIFEALPYSTTAHHYGSRLEFDNDGYLYISVGDRGNRDENPQDLSVFPGKLHRIHDDGSIPDDNPFINQKGAVASIYSYGHRNAQGMTLNPATGKIWLHEHGPRGGDEINIIEKAANYGWPVISYGLNYDGTIFTTETEKAGMIQPIHYWVPSIAPSGMDFVEGNRYPGWEGSLLSGSLRYKYLNRSLITDDSVASEEILMRNIGRLRNVRMAPDGFIYVAVEQPGFIFKLIPIEN